LVKQGRSALEQERSSDGLYLDEALARVHVCMIETNQALGVSKTPGPKMGRIYFSEAY
jgi:hypothetical protein